MFSADRGARAPEWHGDWLRLLGRLLAELRALVPARDDFVIVTTAAAKGPVVIVEHGDAGRLRMWTRCDYMRPVEAPLTAIQLAVLSRLGWTLPGGPGVRPFQDVGTDGLVAAAYIVLRTLYEVDGVSDPLELRVGSGTRPGRCSSRRVAALLRSSSYTAATRNQIGA